MQAVILAAGKGVRMYPLTVSKPKPLIEVANKPVLEHNLEQMAGLAEEAIIVVGYKKDMIIERFGGNYKGIKLTYVVQEEQLGTGHALLQAEEKVKGKFLVLNGDDLYSRKDMECLSKYENCILVKRKKEVAGAGRPGVSGTALSGFGVVVVKEGKVADIVEKPKEFVSDLVNTGMYCFSPEVFGILKSLKKSERGEYEITEAVRELAKQGKMYYEEVKGFWIPVGYPWHVLEATEEIQEEREEVSIKGKLEEGVVVEGAVDIGEGTVIGKGTLLRGNIVIGKNCSVGKDCVLLGFTAIGDGCIIGEEAELENVIVGKGSKLEEGCVVKDSVLGEGAQLSKGVKVENKNGKTGKKESGTVKVKSNGKVYDSGRERLGVLVGDGCKVHGRLKCGECFGEGDRGNGARAKEN